jgi:tetratricopeptide (TPR) repeat protein
MPEPTPASPLTERPCPFITFYSFKGGVGRSMAVINVAGIMASRGFRVMVVDMDLEAPGLSFLANPSPSPSNDGEPRVLQPGFVDFILDAIDQGADGDLFQLSAADAVRRYSAPYELPEGFRRSPDGSLHIMPAGRLDDGYAGRLTRLDLPSLYHDGTGLALIRAFKQAVQDSRQFDYVFIDSRTGFSDESGICTRDLADCLMVVSGLNKQNVEGTIHFLSALRQATEERKPLEVILSPIPNGEDALVDEREARAREAFCEAWGAPVRTELHIPYHPQLALTEEPHIFRQRRGYLFDAYNRIERSVLSLLGEAWNEVLDAAKASLRTKDYSVVEAHLRRLSKLADEPEWAESLAFSVNLSWVAEVGADAVFGLIIEHVSAMAREFFGERIGREALHRQVKEPHVAQVLYERALAADPNNIINLKNYAFLSEEHEDMDTAEAMFKRALEVAPNDVDNLGDFGRFYLTVGRITEGMQLVDRALTSRAGIHPPEAIDAKCWMYVFCCGEPERRRSALEQLQRFVEVHNLTTEDWDFGGVIEQARTMAHPDEAWLCKLAEVLADNEHPHVFEHWPAWRAAASE